MDNEFYTKFSFEGGDLFYVELSIISFRNYLNLVENNFESQKKILLEKYNEHYKQYDDSNNFDSFLHRTNDQLYELEQEFIQRFRQSILIQTFSYVENELRSICTAHSSATGSIYSVNDLKGSSDLDKIKKYLLKSMNIEISKFIDWQFINSLRILRNKIVHENSTIQISDNDYRNLSSFSTNRFQLKSNNPNPTFYNIKFESKDFIEECLIIIEKFIKDVMFEYKPISNK